MENWRNAYLDCWAARPNNGVRITEPPSRSPQRRRNRVSQRNTIKHYLWRTFSVTTHVLLVTYLVVVVVCFLMSTLPDNKIREMDCMRKFLEVMKGEVDREEKSCTTMAEDVRFLREYSTRNIATETSGPIQRLPMDPTHIKHYPATSWINEQLSLLYRHDIPRKNSSKKEVAIMSFIYTNSFDAEKDDSSIKK